MCTGSPEVKPDGSVFTLDTEGTISSGAGINMRSRPSCGEPEIRAPQERMLAHVGL